MSPDARPSNDLAELSKESLESLLEDLREREAASTGLVDVMIELDFRDMWTGDLRFRFRDEITSLSERLDYDRGRRWAITMNGAEHFLRSRNQQAIEAWTEALKLATGAGDKRLESILVVALADVHKALGNYEIALRYGLDSLKLTQEAADRNMEGWVYQGMSMMANDLGNHERALEYARKGEEVFRSLLEETKEPVQRAGLGRSHTEIGIAYYRMGRFEEAEEQHRIALDHYRKADNRIGEARALNDLGRLYQEQDRYDESEALHRQSLEIREAIGARQSQCTSLLNLGELYTAKGEVDAGIKYLHNALKIADETGARLRQFQIHEALARAYKANGNHEASLHHFEEFHRIKEGVASDSVNGRIADLEMRFEIERAEKEAEIERLRNVELKETNDRLNDLLNELQAAQDRLVHAEKMASLGSMTAGIAHEIKNPLNFVNNFAALSVELVEELSESRDPDLTSELIADLKANARRIVEHGGRADRIVRNMLLHAGGQSGTRQITDINRVVDEFLTLAYHGARAQDSTFNVTLKRQLDDSIPEIEAVPQEIGRVIINLASNAFDALKEAETADPIVTVSTRSIDRAIEITVTDNGPGIPQDQHEHVFEPFFTTKPTGSGTGLGLSLSYDIVVNGHGGSLTLTSEPGETAFFIRLPTRET